MRGALPLSTRPHQARVKVLHQPNGARAERSDPKVRGRRSSRTNGGGHQSGLDLRVAAESRRVTPTARRMPFRERKSSARSFHDLDASRQRLARSPPGFGRGSSAARLARRPPSGRTECRNAALRNDSSLEAGSILRTMPSVRPPSTRRESGQERRETLDTAPNRPRMPRTRVARYPMRRRRAAQLRCSGTPREHRHEGTHRSAVREPSSCSPRDRSWSKRSSGDGHVSVYRRPASRRSFVVACLPARSSRPIARKLASRAE